MVVFLPVIFQIQKTLKSMQLGLDMARQTGADLLLETDPDCDRVGIAARNTAGE